MKFKQRYSLVVQNCIFLECKIDHGNKITVMHNMTYCNQTKLAMSQSHRNCQYE